MKTVDHTSNKSMAARAGAASKIVIHNTGDTSETDVLAYYLKKNSSCPHYVISHDGTVHKIVPDDRVAWHVAYSDAVSSVYKRGLSEWIKWRKTSAGIERTAPDGFYDHWTRRWPSLEDPRSLLGMRPNYASIGVELLALKKPTARVFTDQQYDALIELLRDVSVRNSISLSKKTLIGHSDADPISRSNSKGSWDPGQAFDWDGLSRGLAVELV